MKQVRRDGATSRVTSIVKLVGQLPTDRCPTRTQLELLDVTYEIAQAPGVLVGADKVSARSRVGAVTISEAMIFMAASGLVHRDGRTWALTEDGAELAQLRRIDEAQARLFVNHLWTDTGFSKAARTVLARGPLDPGQLAYALVGGKDSRLTRGLYLVDWLAYALLVHRRADDTVALPSQHGETPRRGRIPHQDEPEPVRGRHATAKPQPPATPAAPVVGAWLLDLPTDEAHAALDAIEQLLRAHPGHSEGRHRAQTG